MRMQSLPRALVLAAGMMLIAGGAFAADTRAVTINSFQFAPKTVIVSRGTKVEWTNRDEEPHTVTGASANPAFRSAALDTNDSFSFVFDRPGTYKYFCSIHPQMVGEIIVK